MLLPTVLSDDKETFTTIIWNIEEEFEDETNSMRYYQKETI